MLKRLIQWFSENKKWKQVHRKAWDGMDFTGNGSLSCFQELCESRLVEELTKNNITIRNREVCGSDEIYITGLLGDTNQRYYIYTDGAEIDDISFEKWGYMTPDELFDAFIAAVIKCVKMT